MGDVGAGYSTGVKGTHGELGARLTDRLGSHYSNSLPNLDDVAGGQRQPITGLADPTTCIAGQRGADPNRFDVGISNGVQLLPADNRAGTKLVVVLR